MITSACFRRSLATVAAVFVLAALPSRASGQMAADIPAAPDPQAPATPSAQIGSYSPTAGFKVADTQYGDLNLRVFTYIRYLNQLGTDDTYTNAFGRTSDVQQRNDFQVNKAQVYFFGWIMDKRLRYVTYVWTSNASQGLSAQVLIAGNLSFQFSPRLTLGAGIAGLPGVRSTEGTFPYWLAVDTRMVADEFFRPSYTTGLFANGQIARGLTYDAMLGNNLSQLGIDAGQLNSGLDSFAGTVAWMPTTGEFGRTKGYGDFEHHEKLATRVAAHFTRSNEDRQSQPSTDAFDNVQIRVSDGSVVFLPGLFAPGTQLDSVRYRMMAMDGGVKFKGISVEGDFYRRWIDNFEGPGVEALAFDQLNDRGFQLQASAMVRPQEVQVYGGASKVFGQYGNPWDVRGGVNWFPWKNQVVRWNVEFLQIDRSPVGALSLPYSVGSNGPIVHSNFMIWF